MTPLRSRLSRPKLSLAHLSRNWGPLQDADTEKPNYHRISYAKDILPWLKSCQRHAKDFPILWGTIKQYTTMVERLSGGLTMDSKIRDAMKQHYMAAWEIRKTFDRLFAAQVNDFVQEVKNGIEAQAKRQGWVMEPPSKDHGLVLKCEENWGEATVVWEWDWVGIRFRSEPAVSFGDVEECLHWPGAREDPAAEEVKDVYWAHVPKADFNTEEGIEHLFDESKRGKLAEDIKTRLVQAAEYCDKKLSLAPK